MTDERGNTTSYGYTSNRLTSVTNALSETTDYAYNSTTGLLETITDPLTHTIQRIIQGDADQFRI